MRKHPSIMALTAAIAAGLLGASQAAALGTISYVGKTSDITDLSTLPYGSAGYWFAQFIDYFALSFNTSTAFGPADVSAIRHWSKLVLIVESAISLTLIGLVVARAVNVL